MTAWRAHRLFAGLVFLSIAVVLSEGGLHLAAAGGVWAALVLYFWEDLKSAVMGPGPR
jgi:hypothetical protein